MESAAAAEAEFYAAFAATDLARMRAVWAQRPDCLCIHPAGLPITGYAPVIASWVDILGNSPPVKLRCEPISRIEDTDTMVSTVYERFAAPGTEGAFTPVLATNVYRRIEGAWKIIVHHASPIVSRVQVASDGERMTRH